MSRSRKKYLRIRNTGEAIIAVSADGSGGGKNVTKRQQKISVPLLIFSRKQAVLMSLPDPSYLLEKSLIFYNFK
jgi:hypothetical protein